MVMSAALKSTIVSKNTKKDEKNTIYWCANAIIANV